ncbi:hypothetical protein FHS21_006226 [Phyllobacterium trifolii]|uniref:Uncharacterized protein n=1 Tax=Phyllobacterium trifolii TaxID=300193 RepID=A0A839UM52_9HYPH|nr:glycoside hydrolase family 75 protein [Phyllobacterium trifolii]MBB3149772.1 hypothetical protein [Phyllobacterium trifolii]
MKSQISAAVALSLCWNSMAAATECGMNVGWIHNDTGTITYQAPTGVPSLFYTSKMAINTDGNPRSYHPSDPRGERLALNNMGNGIKGIFKRLGGKYIGCTPRRGDCYERYISTFEAARDSNYNPRTSWVTTYGIIPWQRDINLKRDIPCTFQTGKYAGYFISQTAYPLYDGDECDARRYLDAMVFNANVLPNETHWESQGIVTDGFDLVAVYDEIRQKVVFGINGDRGPKDSIGEVSVAMAANMQGKSLTGTETYEDGILPLALPQVHYLIFPKVDIKKLKGRDFTQQEINEIGATALDEWGGLERLKACLRNETAVAPRKRANSKR